MPHHSKKFGQIYDPVMYLPEELFLSRRRKKLLSGVSGKVFEVGVGTGINLKYYPHDIELTGIEPSPHMLAKADKRKRSLPHPERFTLHNIGCSYPEIEKMFQADSLDVIVCTLVLCTIPEPEKALKNFLKWLKPGGRLLILEHIRSHHRAGTKLQNLVNPTWEKLAEGCQLNRPTDRLIKESGFHLVREKYFWLGIPFYEAEFRKPQRQGAKQGYTAIKL